MEVSAMDSVSGTSKEILLIFLPRDPDQAWISRIETKFPHLEVRWVNRDQYKFRAGITIPHTEGDALEDIWKGVTVAVLGLPPPAHLVQDLRYAQLTSAGADKWIASEVYNNPNLVICTSNGIHS